MRGYPEHLHEVINEDLQESIYDESLEEVGKYFEEFGLTMPQQRKAINYALLFLKNEIPKLQNSIAYGTDESAKELLKKRLKEIEKDEEEFEIIGDRC